MRNTLLSRLAVNAIGFSFIRFNISQHQQNQNHIGIAPVRHTDIQKPFQYSYMCQSVKEQISFAQVCNFVQLEFRPKNKADRAFSFDSSMLLVYKANNSRAIISFISNFIRSHLIILEAGEIIVTILRSLLFVFLC